jgi:hypothetical protein
MSTEDEEWTRTTVRDWEGTDVTSWAGEQGAVGLALRDLAHTLTGPVRRVYVHLGESRAEVDTSFKGQTGWSEVTWEDLYPDA